VPLVARKLATIVTATGEMLESSNAEALVTDALTRSVGLALDAASFDSAPAYEVRPAGLRHGVAALPASTNGDAHTAMVEEMVAVAGAVSVIGDPIVFVASLAGAVAMNLTAYSEPHSALIMLGLTDMRAPTRGAPTPHSRDQTASTGTE